ncbi:hypothetical protein chiPu_0028149, partial [Chiloscyllium punctatum]|nr:hypothetical protein [Chiloscyllium punctatum]
MERFGHRTCFEFSHPCPEAGDRRLDQVLGGELAHDFQLQMERLRGHVLGVRPKRLQGDSVVNGQ